MIRLGNTKVGTGEPCYIIAELGINHSGSLDLALELIEHAFMAGANAVKFQKRTIEICTPRHLWEVKRETPWGIIDYIDYRARLEFGEQEFIHIDAFCAELGIDWFVSVWDEPSIRFMERFDPIGYKIPSALLSNDALLEAVRDAGRNVILSTGGHNQEQINKALKILEPRTIALMQCTATYPAEDRDLNLRVIPKWRRMYPEKAIGYSGHERGIATTVAAVCLGADLIERHITLDRSMWGSDQAASLEPHGFERLIRDIRAVEEAMGYSEKEVLDVERPTLEKLGWHLWE